VSRLVALVALAFCFVAGHFLATLWPNARATSPLAQICARVDYVNSLQENLTTQAAASEEVRASSQWRCLLLSPTLGHLAIT
jgi:hypothetical protein